jgi:hypothetical protein
MSAFAFPSVKERGGLEALQTFRSRLAALEKKAAAEGLLLTETQIAALERKREEGEIETADLAT